MSGKLSDTAWSPQAAAHLLARAGFGGTPDEILALHERGLDGAVNWLLSKNDRPDVEAPWGSDEPTFREALQAMGPTSDTDVSMMRQEARRTLRQNTAAARTAWLNAMRTAKNPLGEKLNLFWHDHFATSLAKVQEPQALWRQIQIFREHGQGPFPELVKLVSRDAAMIFWLDMHLSRKEGPNENFARELLELFTLGEGHYSEDDIAEAARAFTGYRTNPSTGGFRTNPFQLDSGVKKFLGKSGRFTGDDIIEIVCESYESRRFIAGKLWEFFAGDGDGTWTVSQMARELSVRDLRIDAVLGTLFTSSEFYGAAVVGNQVKCPVQWLVFSCKALDVDLPPQPLQDTIMMQLGQVVFQPPNVGGWNWGRAWINGNTLATRHQATTWLLGLRDGTATLPVLRKGGPAPDFDGLVDRSAESVADAVVLRLFGPGTHARVRALAHSELPDGDRHSQRAVASAFEKLMHTPEFQLT